MSNKARFISFEGTEGSGKSTQCQMLYDHLQSQNIKALLTREIGGVCSAEAIREIVVSTELLPMSELMLVFAARLEHIQKLILPKLQDNYSVICDRFIDSTACYQGIHSEIGVEKVYRLHQELVSDILPDITFFIDIDPIEALHRTIMRGNNNKFEQKDLEFHQAVYRAFQKIADRFPARIVKIGATGLTKEALHNKVLEFLPISNER